MPSILIIDDDPSVLRILGRVLTRAGYEVTEAADGATALRRFAGHPTDLVITDMCMPRMGGLELLQRVTEAFPEARIVAMSGGGATDKGRLLEAAEALGACAVLEKPFSMDRVLDVVEACLTEATSSGDSPMGPTG